MTLQNTSPTTFKPGYRAGLIGSTNQTMSQCAQLNLTQVTYNYRTTLIGNQIITQRDIKNLSTVFQTSTTSAILFQVQPSGAFLDFPKYSYNSFTQCSVPTYSLKASSMTTFTCTASNYQLIQLTNFTTNASSCSDAMIYYQLLQQQTQISQYTWSDQTQTTSTEFNYAKFQCCNCYNSSGSNYSSGPLTFLRFNPYLNFIQCQAYAQSVRSYNLNLIGILTNGQTASTNFTLKVVNPCDDQSLGRPSGIQGSQFYYNILIDGSVSMTNVTQFVTSLSCCQYILSMTYLNGSSYNTGIFTLSSYPSAYNLQISCNDLTKAGAYPLIITASYINTSTPVTKTVSFTINLQNPCLTAKLSYTAVSSQTYQVGDSILQVSIPAFTPPTSQYTSICGQVTYKVAMSDGTSLNSNLFTFTNNLHGTLTFSVYTNDPSYVQLYSISVTGWLGTYTQNSQSYTLTVNVTLNCNSAIITASTIPNLQVLQNISNFQVYHFTPFTSSLNCSTFTYNIYSCIQATPSSSQSITLCDQFNVISSNTTFIMGYIDSSVDGYTYDITISGTYSGITQYASFTLTIVSSCQDNTIIAYGLSRFYFDISNTQSTRVKLLGWRTSLSSCQPIQYSWIGEASSHDLVSTYPFFIVQTTTNVNDTLMITHISTYPAPLTYSICVTGSVNTSNSDPTIIVSQTECFNVIITNNCSASNLIPSSQTFTYPNGLSYYVLYSLGYNITFNEWQANPGYCQPVVYYVYIYNSLGLKAPSRLFVRDITTIQIQSSVISDIGSYNIVIVGQLYNNVTINFTIPFSIVANCSKNTLIPFNLDDYYSYNISQPPAVLPFANWEQSYQVADCGDFIYDVAYSVGGQVITTDVITLFTSNFSFVIYTNDTDLVNMSILVTLVGCVQDICQSQVFVVQLLYICYVSTFSPEPSEILNGQNIYKWTLQYYAYDPVLHINFTDFYQEFPCGVATTYNISTSLSPKTTPNFIVSVPKISGFTNNVTFDVYSNSYSQLGSYVLLVNAYVDNINQTDPAKTVINTTTYTMLMYLNILARNLYYPAFASLLKNYSYYVITTGMIFTIKLPSMTDRDPGDVPSISSIDQGDALIRWSQTQITVNPLVINIGKTYTIKIIIIDNNPNPKTTTYSMTIGFTGPPPKTVQNTTDIDSNLTSTEISKSLSATIKLVTNDAQVQVQFSEQITVPDNWSSFNETILNLVLTKGVHGKDSNYDFTWTINNFNPKQMIIKIYWQNPAIISTKVNFFVIVQVKDNIQIIFVANSFFRDQTAGCIDLNYQTNTKFIPLQLRNDCTLNIQRYSPF